MDTKKKSFFYSSAVVLIIIIGIVLRIICFCHNDYHIWADECHSINGSLFPIKDLFTNFTQGTNFLPLYKLLLWFIHYFFEFNWIAFKMPCLIAGIISLFFFYKVIDKIFVNPIVKLSTLILFSVNYSLIWFSTYVKPYEIEVLFVLIMLNSLLSLNNKQPTSNYIIPNKHIFWMTITSILLVFSSVTSIAVIELYWGILFLQNISYKNYHNIKKLLLSQFFITTTIISEYFLLLTKWLSDSSLKGLWVDEYYFKPDSLNAVSALVHFTFFKFQFHDCMHPMVLPEKISILYIITFFIGSILFIKPIFSTLNKNQEVNANKFNGLYILSPVYFFLVLGFLNLYPFTNRLILPLVPLLIIIIFKIFDFNPFQKKFLHKLYKYILNILLIGAVSLSLYYMCSHKFFLKEIIISNETKSEENRKTLDILEKETNDDVLVISTERLCTYCVNNDKIVMINSAPSDYLKYETESIETYFHKKAKKIIYGDFDTKLLEGKNKVFFIIFPFETETDENKAIISSIRKHGFNKQTNIENSNINFMYMIFEK